MDKRPTIKVSKTDAAKRRLETAIRLWFFSQDPVSIHTLAAAAHQILHDIGKTRGAPSMLRDIEGIRPGYEKRVRETINRYENFFKHADKDPEGLLDFNPEAPQGFLLDAVITYEALTREAVPLFTTLKTWIFIHNPELMKDEPREKLTEALKIGGEILLQMSKVDFLRISTRYMSSKEWGLNTLV